ncbi:1848_t:CDS:1, partial [Funneliformis geosporum]
LECLDLSFRYEEEDRLVSTNDDDVFNDFVVIEKLKADLVLGLPWLWLRESKIDMKKQGLTIY